MFLDSNAFRQASGLATSQRTTCADVRAHCRDGSEVASCLRQYCPISCRRAVEEPCTGTMWKDDDFDQDACANIAAMDELSSASTSTPEVTTQAVKVSRSTDTPARTDDVTDAVGVPDGQDDLEVARERNVVAGNDSCKDDFFKCNAWVIYLIICLCGVGFAGVLYWLISPQKTGSLQISTSSVGKGRPAATVDNPEFKTTSV